MRKVKQKQDESLEIANSWFKNVLSSNKKVDGEIKVTKEELKKLSNAIKTYRGFQAAKSSSMSGNWTYGSTRIDADAQRDQEKLVNLARNLEQNNGVMKKYLNMVETNVVGPDGFVLNSTIRADDSEEESLDIKANNLFEEHYAKWGKAKYADISGKLSFKEMQRVAARTLKRDGEILIRIIRSKATRQNPYGFSLQLLDPQRIDTTWTTKLKGENGNLVVMGVEMDTYGRPVAYWLRPPKYDGTDVFSGSFRGQKRERIDCRDIIHRFKAISQEQTRGIPEGHAVFQAMKDLSEFMEAALWASKIGAASSLFLESTDPTSDEIDPETMADVIETDELNNIQNFVMEIDPGSIRMLPPNRKLSKFEPSYPSSNFVSYVAFMLKQIASGLNVSYFVLANSLEDVNYTSSRTGLLEERDGWMREQEWFKENILEPIYEDWLETALMNGAIKYSSGASLPLLKLEKFCNYKFYARRWQWVDPLKDSQAYALMLELGLTSLTKVLAERGIEYEDILADRKRERNMRATYGEPEPVAKDKKPTKPIKEDEDEDEVEVAEDV